ncbi:DMT family transporter [Cuniculiplasma divulgatum]|jgi:drug/metabolite transporter (DMT)-like permease|uniref:DME family DMT superfamily transporter n=1 Tax=Cuniculiplasma divulgatum TaxID=1673428 RepID=A0A1N5TAH7_9ARCH|nr:DMT family transporter [Cuniculiplasma divulgatum]EQB68604.1 MAG: transporter [Thermoplasmatales archaeon Gpl]MCI2412098.1 DMT family transporter [Cuniculiplasma sp.]WMT48706.1 MAG: DMT family transporter [Thermoplasmatales archaeon]SIM45370.1 DME family DMT superfamily transporter [Cuniculiplasma divulgatum]
MQNETKYSFLIIIATLSWGITFPLIKISLEYMSPVIFLAIRFLISTIVMIPFIKNRSDLTGLRQGFIAGFFLFLGYYFQTIGLYFTTPAISGFVTGLYIVLVPVIAYLIFRQRISKSDLSAVTLAFVGLLIITVGEVSNFSLQLGDLLTFICAVGYAMQIIYVSRNNKLDMVKFTFFQMAAVSLYSTIAIPTFKIYFNFSSPILIFTIAFTAIFAGVVAYFITNKALVYVKPEKASIIMVSEPVFAAIFSVILTGIPLSYYTIGGGALMVIAMLMTIVLV